MTVKRDATIDVARGFIVLIMPAVHSVLLYSTAKTQASWLGILLGLLAEGPGAQLFMLLLGLSLTLGRPKTWGKVLRRAGLLLLLAYLLNFFKLVVPYWSGRYPAALWDAYGVQNDSNGTLTLLGMGDILVFAAMAYLLVYVLYRLRKKVLWTAISMVLVTMCAYLSWDRHSDFAPVDYLLALIGGQPPQVFFPLFPWLVYPLGGLLLGMIRQRMEQPPFYRWLLVAGLLLMIAGKAMVRLEPASMETDFYRTGSAGTLFHLGIVFLWLCLCRLAVKKFPVNGFFRLLGWLSKDITRVYILQWIIVVWMLPLYGFRQLGMIGSIAALLLNTAITFGINRLIQHYRHYKPFIFRKPSFKPITYESERSL